MPDPTSDLVRRSFGVAVRSIDLERRSVDVIASTNSIDAHGEYIDQASWDLKRYEANPCVLYHHNREGWSEALEPKYTLPIGHAENVRVVKNALEATLVFVDEKASPMAEYVWQGLLQKSIRGVSVGFKPHTVRSEITDGKDIYKLSECELFEISICPMGANPDAVVKSADITQLKALASRGTHTTEPTAQEPSMTIDQKTLDTIVADHAKALEVERAKTLDAGKALEKSTADLAAAKAAHETAIKSLGDALAGQAEEKDADPIAAATKCIARLGGEVATKASALIDAEVDALVGKKITLAEKPEMVELAKSNKSLFDKMIAKRVDMKLDEKIVGVDPKAASTASLSASAGDELANLIDSAN